MPVQNNLDLATGLLQILILTTLSSLLCQNIQYTFQLCPEKWFVRKKVGYYPQKVIIENSVLKFLPVQKGGFQENAYIQLCL